MRHTFKLLFLVGSCLLAATLHAQTFDNRGFQHPALDAGVWLSQPTDPSVVWQGANSWGIANGSGSWGQIGAQGTSQYAYLQNDGTIYQDVNGFVPGKYYQITFWMARRNGSVGGNTGTEVGVTLDDSISIFDPSGPTDDGQWNKYATYAFQATKDTYRIRWQGTLIGGTDRTSLIDNVSVLETTTPAIGQGTFLNRGFELPILAANSWQSKPTSIKTVWRGTGSWGIANGFTPWGDAAALGSQYAFLQCLGDSASIYQTVGGFTPGQLYRIKFYLAKRTGSVGGNGVGVSVLLDDTYTILPSTLPNTNGTWRVQYTGVFRASQTQHTFRWLTDPWNGEDRSSLLDGVVLSEVSTAPVAIAEDGDLEFPVLNADSFVLDPNLGSDSWSGANEWGIANGKTPYGAGGESSPQYGFLRSTVDGGPASMTATLKDLIPGQTYRVRFSLAKKAKTTGDPVKVLLDGDTLILKSTAPTGTAWASFVTATFTATSVEQHVTFQGAYATPDKPNRISLMDNVTVEQVIQ